MLENSLPSFWKSGLSETYADTKVVNEIRVPPKMSREEKIRKAKELHDSDWTDSQIGRYFSGISNFWDIPSQTIELRKEQLK